MKRLVLIYLLLLPFIGLAEDKTIITIQNSKDLPKELPQSFILKIKDKTYEVYTSDDPERGQFILIDQLTKEIIEFFTREEVCYFLQAF